MSIRVLGAVAVLVAGCGGVDGQDTAAVDPVVLAQGKQTFRHDTFCDDEPDRRLVITI